MFRTSSVHLQERFVQAVCADWYVVLLCVLLDTSSRYGWTCRVVRVLPHTNLRIQLVKDTPDDGPMRSETCRANVSAV